MPEMYTAPTLQNMGSDAQAASSAPKLVPTPGPGVQNFQLPTRQGSPDQWADDAYFLQPFNFLVIVYQFDTSLLKVLKVPFCSKCWYNFQFSRSDIGSTIDTSSMSSNDHEEAIIRLVQESQVPSHFHSIKHHLALFQRLLE